MKRDAGVNLANLTGFTALHHAAEAGQKEAAVVLLELGADKRILNRAGISAGEVALARGHGDVAAVLGN